MIGIVFLWCKYQLPSKLRLTEKCPNTGYDVAIVKLDAFTSNHKLLRLEWRAPR
jgi:hypothetical protein